MMIIKIKKEMELAVMWRFIKDKIGQVWNKINKDILRKQLKYI